MKVHSRRSAYRPRIPTGIWLSVLIAGALISAAVGAAERDQFSLWKVDTFKPAPAIALPLYESPTRESLSLDGPWEVRPDPEECGLEEQWFSRDEIEFSERLQVPGNWIAQGLGGAGTPSDLEVMYTELSMRSAKLKGSYLGLVWYRKRAAVPANWADQRVRLIIGAVLNSVRLWVNGSFVGGRWTDGNSFFFDVTSHITAGRTNTFVMAIDNRWKEAATRSHLQWYVANGGPYHHMVLRASPKVRIETSLVRPILKTSGQGGIAEVHIKLANLLGADQEAQLEIQIVSLQDSSREFKASTMAKLKAGETNEVVLPVEISPVEPWSVDSPNLYKLTTYLRCGDLHDTTVERFGMRTVASIGNRFYLNGQPLFILGQHFNFFWPNTFTPPITKAEYTEHLKLMKEYGFNYLRTPWLMPEECYQAADELGMMLQLEFPYAFAPYDKIKLPLIKRLIEECLVAFGNHPSLVLLTMSNEGSWDKMGELNPEFCAFSKSIDPTRLVMDTDGTRVGDEFTDRVMDSILAEVVSTGNQTGIWAEYMKNVARQSEIYHLRPVIDHEFLNVPSLVNPEVASGYGQAVVAPPQDLGPKLREQIQSQGMEAEYPLYVNASHHHQANFIKEGIERSRKNPFKAGYSMCAWNDIEHGIHWGILDAFLNPKGISPEEMQAYNSQNVLLADFVDPETGQIQLVPDYCRTLGKEFSLQPYVAYFGHVPVTGATLRWQIHGEGEVLAEGRVDNISLQIATTTTLPRINVGPIPGSVPRKAILKLKLPLVGADLENSWPIWLFPRVQREGVDRKVYASVGVLAQLQRIVKDVLPAEEADSNRDKSGLWITSEPGLALSWLHAGKKVLYLANEDASHGAQRAGAPEVTNAFDPGWFKSDKHMGTIIRPNSLMGQFPHDGYASWQFRHLISRIKRFPAGPLLGRPIISSVFNDTMPHVQHQLLTARVGTGGHLTYCLLNVLSGQVETDYLLLQLVNNSKPVTADPLVDIDQLRRFWQTLHQKPT